MRGYDTVTITQEFTAAQTLNLTRAEVKLTRSPVTVELAADPSTDITITQSSKPVQQQVGPGKVLLPEGSYELIVKGPANVASSRPLTVSGPGAQVVDVRNLVVSGMERFDMTGWTRQDAWFTRHGGNFVLYNRQLGDGTIAFTVKLDRNGNPFSSGSRLNWVVGFVDSRNYVLLQIEKDAFFRSVISSGTSQPPTRLEHHIPTNVAYVNMRVRIAGTQLLHEYSVRENVWQTIDAWQATTGPDPKRAILSGSFGFFLPGTEEVAISNFFFYPPTKQ